MTVQNVVVCDQNPDWVYYPFSFDPSGEWTLDMWQKLARDCPDRWAGLTFRITVEEVES